MKNQLFITNVRYQSTSNNYAPCLLTLALSGVPQQLVHVRKIQSFSPGVEFHEDRAWCIMNTGSPNPLFLFTYEQFGNHRNVFCNITVHVIVDCSMIDSSTVIALGVFGKNVIMFIRCNIWLEKRNSNGLWKLSDRRRLNTVCEPSDWLQMRSAERQSVRCKYKQ